MTYFVLKRGNDMINNTNKKQSRKTFTVTFLSKIYKFEDTLFTKFGNVPSYCQNVIKIHLAL